MIRAKVANYYNQQSYIENAVQCAQKRHFIEIEKIKRYIKFEPNWKTLEIGCSKGVLKDEFPNWTGLDISKKALANIPEKYPTILAPAEKIPIKDKSFNLVVMFDTIEHLQAPKQALNEAIRVLKPEGYLIIRSPQLIWSPRRLKSIKAPFIVLKELIARIADEIKYFLGEKVKFRFLKNIPDYTKIGADWDATYLFSPHNILLFLKSGYGMVCLNQKLFPLRLGIDATYQKIMIFQK
jgi:ubiquinone/menaquinone biosynthesis C-methylase UbiE